MSRKMILRKLKCKKCGNYYESKYSNDELMKRFPFIESDKSYKNLINISKFIDHKRELKCSNCGSEKKISKKLLMQISKLRHDLK